MCGTATAAPCPEAPPQNLCACAIQLIAFFSLPASAGLDEAILGNLGAEGGNPEVGGGQWLAGRSARPPRLQVLAACC